MAFIEIIPPEDATGELKEVYDEAAGRRGKVAEVLRLHSLMPSTLRSHLNLYMDIMYGKGELTRLQREAIGVVVSAANKCLYCVTHHQEALVKYLKDRTAVDLLAKDLEKAPIDPALKVLCRHAVKITKTPAAVTAQDVQLVREAGWSDAAILHGTLIAGYFNFVNRNVLTLGIEIEPDQSGYKY